MARLRSPEALHSDTGKPLRLRPRLRWLWLTLVVVLVDRATKGYFETQTPVGFRSERLSGILYFVHSRNPGIGFGLLSDTDSPWLRAALIAGSLIIIGIIAWLLASGKGGGRMTAAGLALLLGGATGNLTDRILHGAVTDFLEVWLRFLPWRAFNPWPAFNVADSAIAIGAALVILDVIFGPRTTARESARKHPA